MITRYIRLYADASGESHFAEVAAELGLTEFAPPAPPLYLSGFTPATQFAFFGAPAGWRGEWHQSSARNLFVVVSGRWEIEASDGTTRQFGPGDVLLCEDTVGKGHASRVLGDQSSLAILLQLPLQLPEA